MIPQYVVHKGKILCADYFSTLSIDNEYKKLEAKLKKFAGFKDIVTYCKSL